jgi:hypothetical protein
MLSKFAAEWTGTEEIFKRRLIFSIYFVGGPECDQTGVALRP